MLLRAVRNRLPACLPTLAARSSVPRQAASVRYLSTINLPNVDCEERYRLGKLAFSALAAGAFSALGLGTLAGHAYFDSKHGGKPKIKGADKVDPKDDGPTNFPRPDLPTFPLAEVKSHDCREAGVWVSFRGGVYDVTEFIDAHPGGSTRLLMAAGCDLEPFYDIYRQHYRGHFLTWIQKYRIGNLSVADAKQAVIDTGVFSDPYEDDPQRHPNLLGTTQRPWCGEPRIDLLVESGYYTPNELFYVRNHLPVPVIEEEEWELVVKGNGIAKHKFTLEDLKTKFPKVEVTSALQCAGNRREDFHKMAGTDRLVFISPHWVVGAMSNAKWGGVRMRDVLSHCGMDVDGLALGKTPYPEDQKHVQFEGYDCDETGLTYGGSVPVDKVVDPWGDVIIAYEMNGEPLPRDHGYPARALIPGHAGARSCKWLNKIIVSAEESNRPWHQKSYRAFAPDITFEKDLSHWPHGLRLDQAPIIQEMPVQSFVCAPKSNQVIGVDKEKWEVNVKGVAWSGGGRGIHRVDVSIDGGQTFTASELYKPIKQPRNKEWGWTQFSKTIPLKEDQIKQLKAGKPVELEVLSKAMNTGFDVQPERPEPYYNARGVVVNHWYRVPVTVDPTKPKDFANKPWVGAEYGNVPSGGKFGMDWKHHGWTGKRDSSFLKSKNFDGTKD